MATNDSTQDAPKGTRRRSPNFPGIPLGKAVERATTLWETDQHHAVPYNLIVKRWGYSEKSSGGAIAFAALKRFGMLESQGKTHGKLTPLGVELVKGARAGKHDYTKLREAALRPPIHKELWDTYGKDQPSDDTLEYELADRGFTRGGAVEFAAEWRQTREFAKLGDSSVSVSDEDDESDQNGLQDLMASIETPVEDQQLNQQDQKRRENQPDAESLPPVPIFLSGGKRVVIAGFPLTADQWQTVINAVDAQGGLIRDSAEPSDD